MDMWHVCCDGEEEKGRGETGRTGDQMLSDTFRGELFTFKTEEEASQDIKEKMSTTSPPTYGQDVHVTRDVVIEFDTTILGECGVVG